MYKNDSYVESDLVNSYAWDTAIVYIQEMENTNYANQIDNNEALRNTGSTGDEKCKIFDMAGNAMEWTTEYSTKVINNIATACTFRGGNGYFTSYRGFGSAGSGGTYFRTILYVK